MEFGHSKFIFQTFQGFNPILVKKVQDFKMSEFVPGESIVQRVYVAVLINFPPVCEKVCNFRFPENPRVEKKRAVE